MKTKGITTRLMKRPGKGGKMVMSEVIHTMTTEGLVSMLKECESKNKFKMLRSIKRNKKMYEIETKYLKKLTKKVIGTVVCDFINCIEDSGDIVELVNPIVQNIITWLEDGINKNRLKLSKGIPQPVIDTVLCDFINHFIGSFQHGRNYDLTPKYLK